MNNGCIVSFIRPSNVEGREIEIINITTNLGMIFGAIFFCEEKIFFGSSGSFPTTQTSNTDEDKIILTTTVTIEVTPPTTRNYSPVRSSTVQQDKTMEIELNFRLDGYGRTAYQGDASNNVGTTTTNEQNESGSTSTSTSTNDVDIGIEYSSKTIMTNLAAPPPPPPTNSSIDTDAENNHRRQQQKDGEEKKKEEMAVEEHRKWIDDLLFDCQLSDCGLMPRTFWVSATGMRPRFTLEQLALDVFHHHVPSNVRYDPAKSGAEWWVQIRPSPEGTGRYSMHDAGSDEMTKTGISFHWDKDEDLRLLTGGTTYIHPHISTVTYLTDFGSPTLAVNCRVHNLTGQWIVPGDGNTATNTATTGESGNDNNNDNEVVEAFISWPKAGKHLSFDGRYLHAAPPDLMESGLFDRQIRFEPCTDDEREQKLQQRRHRRVTFLVNIWLNYQPFEVKAFPETMVDKMSGVHDKKLKNLLFHKELDGTTTNTTKSVSINGMKAVNDDGADCHLVQHVWPLGDCGSEEYLEAHIPLETIRRQQPNGDNLQIRWNNVSPPPAADNEKKSSDPPHRPLFKLRKGQRNEEDNEPSSKRSAKEETSDNDANKRVRSSDK